MEERLLVTHKLRLQGKETHCNYENCQPEEVTILHVCQPIAGLQAEEARSHRAGREKEGKEVREKKQGTQELARS